MRAFINNYTTAITTALFLVVGVSGVAMFFHVGTGIVREMHEWLAAAMVLAVGLHVYKNWCALKIYLRRGTIFAPLALTLVAAGAFVVPAALSERGDHRARHLMHAFNEARLSDIGQVLGVAPDALQKALKEQGYVIASAEQRLSEIARQSEKPATAVLKTAFAASNR